MKLTRSVPAALLASVLAVTACAPTDDNNETSAEETSAPDADGETATETGEATAGPDTGDTTADATDGPTDAPGDEDEATDGPGSDSSAVTASANLSAEEAQEILEGLLETAADASEATGEEAQELRIEAFAGSELRAQRGTRRIERRGGGEPEFVFDAAADEPLVISISRRELYGEDAPFFLGQTVREDDVPVLHLVAFDEEQDDYRIVWQAPMLPGTELEEFNALSLGSPVRAADDDDDLFDSPEGVLNSFADDLAYPEPAETGDIDDEAYIEELQGVFAQQEEAVAGHAEFSQDHHIRRTDIRVLDHADGSTMVFGVLLRTSTLTVLPDQQLEATPAIGALAQTTVFYNEVEVTTSVMVAMRVTDESPAEMLAVREQLVAAEGS